MHSCHQTQGVNQSASQSIFYWNKSKEQQLWISLMEKMCFSFSKLQMPSGASGVTAEMHCEEKNATSLEFQGWNVEACCTSGHSSKSDVKAATF